MNRLRHVRVRTYRPSESVVPPLGSPKIDRKAQVTGPERISAAPVFLTRFPALSNCRHPECAGSFEPHWTFGSTIELEERVTIAARAAAETGAFRERPGKPGCGLPRYAGKYPPGNVFAHAWLPRPLLQDLPQGPGPQTSESR
jgi:hypothetical protein